MATYEIPTGPSPRQMTIDLGSSTYTLRLFYADAGEGGWILNIGDALGNALVCGIPLVTGCDLLEQYAYVGIRGRLFVYTDGSPGTVPGYADLGAGSHLYFEPSF